MNMLLSICACLLGVLFPFRSTAQELQTSGSLREAALTDIQAMLPSDTRLMLDAASIEALLDALDGAPPDWKTVYGHGHHDPGHDDRLFDLNRSRDAAREGKPAMAWLLSFAWLGTLSSYDAALGGFPVALGPKFIPTKWGVVRFKPEEAPGSLVVFPSERQRQIWQQAIAHGESVDIDVVMTGHLVQNESFVYDFSHDQEGLGLIMPFVRVERVDFFLFR